MCPAIPANEGVGDVEDVAVGQPIFLEELEPVVGNSVERGALSRHTLQTTLPVPDAIKGGNAVGNDHDGQWSVGGNIVALLLDETLAIFFREPIHGAHLAAMDWLVRADGEVVVHSEDLVGEAHLANLCGEINTIVK